MNNNLYLLVMGMAVVTYIPRYIPMVLFSSLDLPPFLEKFLFFIPYAVLSSLIFPAILFSTKNIESAMLGGLVSIILAFFDINLFFIVIGGISGVLIWQILL